MLRLPEERRDAAVMGLLRLQEARSYPDPIQIPCRSHADRMQIPRRFRADPNIGAALQPGPSHTINLILTLIQTRAPITDPITLIQT